MSLWLAVAAVLVPASAGPQTTPQARRELQQQITRSRAEVVDPAVIQRAAETVPPSAPPSAPADAPAAAASPATVTPQPQLSVTTLTASAFPSAIRRVNPGELLYVPLDERTESAAETLLKEQVAASESHSHATLTSFGGAVRQLSADNQEVQLKSYVLVGQPLQYDRHAEQFIGTVLVGVADLFGGSGGPRSLTVPMQFEVLESALVNPQRVALEATSPPYQSIRVTSRVLGEPVVLRVASNFSREGVTVTIPVEPTLIVNVDGNRLRAFGMQTTRLSVRAVGAGSAPQGAVTLRAPGAFLEHPEPLTFDASGTAHATLRTDSPGEVTVSAFAAGYAPGSSLPVLVIWPWPTLAATGIGGLVGGFVRLAGRIRRGMNLGQFILGLIVSILVGMIVFALYVVGVKVLPVSFSVEVGDIFAFAAAALAGWFGVAVLPKLPARGAA